MVAGLTAVLVMALAGAQLPTGSVTGTVKDVAGAAIANGRLEVVDANTGSERVATSAANGTYRVSALPPGEYVVSASAPGFQTTRARTAVTAGTTTSVELVLRVIGVTETVHVADRPLLQRDQHQFAGVITRDLIEAMPLNGRNFLDLAQLEPGVTNVTRGSFGRTFVPVLGSGLQTIPRIGATRITVDGASVMAVGTIGTAIQISPESVREVQTASVNVDPSAGQTTSGVLNIVTRAGSNAVDGSVFAFYRDDSMAAYPALARDPRNPDPFFRRTQAGAAGGGPLRRNHLFVFGAYERHVQHGVVSVQSSDPALTSLGGLFGTPAYTTLLTARLDAQLARAWQLTTRWTRDGTAAFSGTGLPSAWMQARGATAQRYVAVTAAPSPALTNELRVSYLGGETVQRPPTPDECGTCFGFDAPRITVSGANLVLGPGAAQDIHARRYELSDAATYLRGAHTIRIGGSWEHSRSRTSLQVPLQLTLWSPTSAAARGLSLPERFATASDILALPLRTLTVSVGPATIPERRGGDTRVVDAYRIFASDAWRLGDRLVVQGGLAWAYEPNALNTDLSKPAWLAPLLGADRLGPARSAANNLLPSAGLTWSLREHLAVHAGAGRYADPLGTTNSVNLSNERALLLPLGTGRVTVTGASLRFDGRPLQFAEPTAFRGANALSALPEALAAINRLMTPGSAAGSARTIDLLKSGANLYTPEYTVPSAIHMNLGVEYALGTQGVARVDGVYKGFSHTFLNGVDYNHWNRWNGSARPVIPACTPAQAGDLTAACSTDSIFFDTTTGRARYLGLLARVEGRAGAGVHVLASYALGSYVGSNGTGTGTSEATGGRVFGFNTDDPSENYGPLPTDLRHTLNIAASARLPAQFSIGLNVAAHSAPPFSAHVADLDFNGDGTANDLLPGSAVNQFGRRLDEADLRALVAAYNSGYASRRFGARTAPFIELPEQFRFDEPFCAVDLRLSRSFPAGGARRLHAAIEVFNALNTSNGVGYSGNLAQPSTFGRATGRTTQVFGTGGPRAAQLALRLTF